MPADTTAIVNAPTVKAPARERFCGGLGWLRYLQLRYLRLRRHAAVRVISLAVRVLLLLGRVSPVVWLLLLVAGMPVLTGIYRRAVIAWPPALVGRRR